MLSRREMLRRAALLTLGAVALDACGKQADTPVAQVEPTRLTAAPTAPPTVTAPAIPPTDTLATVTSTHAPAAEPAVTVTRVPPSPTPDQAYLAVVRGANPEAITRAAVDALGGMGRFVHAGDDVIVKPNICIASYGPEYGATTNPAVVAAVVKMCLEAGAARVRVIDLPFSGTAAEAYKISGIAAAVEAAGGKMEIPNMGKYVDTKFPATARNIKNWLIYQDVLKANALINLPIAKVHDASGLTLGMKNLMGIVRNRSDMHLSLHQRIADLSTVVKPVLNIVDGVRVLTQHGPQGGNLDWVLNANTVIASHDIIAADAYAAQLFFKTRPDKVGYIKLGDEMGLGKMDLTGLNVKEVSV
ncbi:MAG: DUF362 domain-containing protein [Anaerolineae bacterium]